MQKKDPSTKEPLLSNNKPFYSKENPFQKNIDKMVKTISDLLEKKDFTSLTSREVGKIDEFYNLFKKTDHNNIELEFLKIKIRGLVEKADTAFEDLQKTNKRVYTFDEDGNPEEHIINNKYNPDATNAIEKLSRLAADLSNYVTSVMTSDDKYVPPSTRI